MPMTPARIDIVPGRYMFLGNVGARADAEPGTFSLIEIMRLVDSGLIWRYLGDHASHVVPAEWEAKDLMGIVEQTDA